MVGIRNIQRKEESSTIQQNQHATNTTDTQSENELAGTSKFSRTKSPSSLFDLNYECLKENPFQIPNILVCLCENSSSQALFKYRLVHSLWNELIVTQIKKAHPGSLRLVKVVDPNYPDEKCSPGVVLVNVKELISTLSEGKLKKSLLTRIYLNSSLSRFDLNTFLQLNGQNIETLHYDGISLEDLRQILKSCSKNLKSLSLWRSWEETEDDNKGLFKNNDDFTFPRLHRLCIVSGEMSTRMDGVRYSMEHNSNNLCSPSKEFVSDLFQASPNLKSLSARLFDSNILESGLCFNKLTSLCIKFKIRNDQLQSLCEVGLKLKSLRLQGLFIAYHEEENYRYMDDPEWVVFRRILLKFIQTQANTLEYFAVFLHNERYFYVRTQHDSPHEQWSSGTGFPRMPNLHTLIMSECSGRISKPEFGYLFPKLRNLEITECWHRLMFFPFAERPLQIPSSSHPSISVQNIRGIKPTLELAQIFPSVIEFHIKKEIPHELPICWPKLKHLYYKDSCDNSDQSVVVAKIRQINKLLVGISPEESEGIESQHLYFDARNYNQFHNMELPRSRPSILDLKELETFEFGFISYEFEPPFHTRPFWISPVLQLLITLGLSRLTHLKKLHFGLEQRPRPSENYALPQTSLDGLTNVFTCRNNLNISTNCDKKGEVPRKHLMKKWTLELNSNHHISEWKDIDRLFCEDPDICDLSLPFWNIENDEYF